MIIMMNNIVLSLSWVFLFMLPHFILHPPWSGSGGVGSGDYHYVIKIKKLRHKDLRGQVRVGLLTFYLGNEDCLRCLFWIRAEVESTGGAAPSGLKSAPLCSFSGMVTAASRGSSEEAERDRLQTWRGHFPPYPRLFPLQVLLLPLLLGPTSLALPQPLWITSPLSRQRDQYNVLMPEESQTMEPLWAILCDAGLPIKQDGRHWQIWSIREKFPV